MGSMMYFALLSTNVSYQLSLFALIALYTLVGLMLMIGSVMLFNWIFKLDIRKELIKDQNAAMGILFAGVFVAIAIIIAASIVG
jgi:uncharacterized membrane protein YjfL (UPF0719 family)